MIKLSVVCCILFFGGISIADNVPVLILGTSDHYVPALALETVNSDKFIDIFSEHLKPDTITLIFAEKQLTTEDLSQCRTPNGNTCFKGIQQMKSKLYLPSVEDPFSVMEDIAASERTASTLLSNGSLSEPINPEGGNFIFVNIEAAASDETKESKLSRHDKLITKLYADLSAQNLNVLIVFTGKRAEHQKRIVRQAVTQASTTASTTSATTSATTSTTDASTQPKQSTEGIFWKRDRLLMYYHGLQTIVTDTVGTETATDIIVDSITLNEATPGRIGVSMVAGTNTFAFNITGENGYWWLDGFEWNDRPILSSHRIAAVETFSFHCAPAINIGTFNRDVLVRWTGLQIQPEFATVADQTFDSFGDSWDCVGFVSPGIVGGLFVVIMLLFILSIGISWMMDINTMDRFDDPKGKTITISVNE